MGIQPYDKTKSQKMGLYIFSNANQESYTMLLLILPV